MKIQDSSPVGEEKLDKGMRKSRKQIQVTECIISLAGCRFMSVCYITVIYNLCISYESSFLGIKWHTKTIQKNENVAL